MKRLRGLARQTQNTRDASVENLSKDVREAIAAALALAGVYKVLYWIPHKDQDPTQTSPMGWYSPGIQEAAGPVRFASTLPADVRELFTSLEQVLAFRLKGLIWPAIFPMQLSSLAEAVAFVESKFQVFITNNAEVADAVDAVRSAWLVPTLHISSVRGEGREAFESTSISTIAAFSRRVLDFLAKDAQQADFVLSARRAIAGAPQRKLQKHWMASGSHNLTAPNELALMAFGWKFAREDRISVPLTTDEEENREQRYVDRICAAADAVFDERAKLARRLPPGVIDSRYILTVASMYWGHFKGWRELAQKAEDVEFRSQIKQALAATVLAQTYFGRIAIDEERKPVAGRVYMLMRGLYAQDMHAFTSALAMMSTATLLPVLRLEPKLNQARGNANVLAHCVRASANWRFNWKVSRLASDLSNRMRSLINPQFLSRIDAPETSGRIEGMKLVSDLPLELMRSNGVPLALRYDCSRLPPVPGNLFWQACLMQPILVPLKSFEEVLVVRSFRDDDPLRTLLEKAVSVVQRGKHSRRIRYRFVDVSSEAEFVAAVKSCVGAILIFDGHGQVDPELGMGSPIVGGKPLNIWNLKRVVQFPPIVMFSACDTQPIDGSHSSVATAAFALGARAVLGTLFPVNGVNAALFNGRLLLRLEQYLGVALKVFPHVTWRDVVSGMVRMMYVTESTDRVNTALRLNLSEELFGRIQFAANRAINARRANWHSVFVGKLAEVTGRTIDEISMGLNQYCGLVDSLKYVQLGTPERIVIVREHPMEILAREQDAEIAHS